MNGIDVVAAGFLLVLSITDIRRRVIPVEMVIFMGVTLFAVRWLTEGVAWEMVQGMLPGAIVVLFAQITKEKIGMGDGMVLLVLGLGYEMEAALWMFGVALLAAALFSVLLLVLKKATRKTELPFLPFLLTGQVLYAVSGGF